VFFLFGVTATGVLHARSSAIWGLSVQKQAPTDYWINGPQNQQTVESERRRAEDSIGIARFPIALRQSIALSRFDMSVRYYTPAEGRLPTLSKPCIES
jgi:hypothetical protein